METSPTPQCHHYWREGCCYFPEPFFLSIVDTTHNSLIRFLAQFWVRIIIFKWFLSAVSLYSFYQHPFKTLFIKTSISVCMHTHATGCECVSCGSIGSQLEYFVPSWWSCLRKLGRYGRSSVSLGVGFVALKDQCHPVCPFCLLLLDRDVSCQPFLPLLCHHGLQLSESLRRIKSFLL